MTKFSKFEKVAKYYLSELNKYSYDLFIMKPDPKVWSLGEMYNHIIDTGYRQLGAAKECAVQPADSSRKKSLAGKIVFTFNTIPPVKAKAPKDLADLIAQPSSVEEVRERLFTFIEVMRISEAEVIDLPADQKVKHPYFGYLNAYEWYEHVESHFRHHLRQKKRIEGVVLGVVK